MLDVTSACMFDDVNANEPNLKSSDISNTNVETASLHLLQCYGGTTILIYFVISMFSCVPTSTAQSMHFCWSERGATEKQVWHWNKNAIFLMSINKGKLHAALRHTLKSQFCQLVLS